MQVGSTTLSSLILKASVQLQIDGDKLLAKLFENLQAFIDIDPQWGRFLIQKMAFVSLEEQGEQNCQRAILAKVQE